MVEPSLAAPCIGVFDSGVGGLSVLMSLRRSLPGTSLLYIADSAHAPYGEQTAAAVVERALRVTEHMLRQGARLIVVACNTATALAIDALRQRWPDVPFVGVEPGIKPARALTHTGCIAVLATPATVASFRLRRLVERHGQGVFVRLQPCPGLAAAIELANDAEIAGLLDRFCAPLRAADVDTVVLGCTHYAFVAARIQEAMGLRTKLVDTTDAVVRRVVSLWGPCGTAAGVARLWSTGDPALLAAATLRWLGSALPCEAVTVPR